MSLNFKLLKRSFSLRNNVPEDKDDKNVPNLLRESIWLNRTPKISSSVEDTNFQRNSADVRITRSYKEPSHVEMEYFQFAMPLPYTRFNATSSSTGMQIRNVKKIAPECDPDAQNTATNKVAVSSKTIQKHVLNQPFKNLKVSSETEFSPTKMSKKQLKLAQEQLKKLTKINIHLHALFSAVENGQPEKAKSILELTDVNVNCINGDALSPLDVAVLSNNRPLTKILLEHGASHGAQFKNSDSLGNHLNSLLEDALNKINDFTCGSSDDIGENAVDKQIDFWQRRANSLQRILRGWVQSTSPNSPNCVSVEVTSSTSVAVKVQESLTGALTTKFKIQWSFTVDFGRVIDEREINDLTNSQGIMSSTLHLYNLVHGQRYYFRALSGNIKGWSEHRVSSPSSVVPSSWQDIAITATIDNKTSIDDLMAEVRDLRKLTSSEIQLDAPIAPGLCIKKKATIKQLFTATSKFQRNLKRGIYLACLFYHDGKVLLTNDDLLPVIEIDENYPTNFYCELMWLSMKMSCNWDIVKAMRNEMEKYHSSVNQFRLKILAAMCQMQSAMGLKDLGRFYIKPLQDSQGTVVFSCTNYIKNPKSISVLNSRWVPMRKIQRKQLPISGASSMNEIVIASIPNQIEFYQQSCVKLSKGLYVGYVKMHCSMEQMHVLVPKKTPNVLPHYKVRDNPHLCAEEWEVLQETFNQKQKTEMQRRFLDALSSAAMRVFKYMGVSTECMLQHKLYNLELIRLNHDVSFLVICPPIELSCQVEVVSSPGPREMLLQRADLMSIPIQAFQMCQLFTYHNENIRKCARTALVLDLEIAEASHRHREAFSTCETQAAKEHLDRLKEVKTNLWDYYKNTRWLLDVMTFTRNRCSDSGISMRAIFNVETPPTEPSEAEKKVEQTEPALDDDNVVTKRSPCRFSWPNNNRKEQVTTELSKSDQQLNFVMANVKCRRAADVDGSRRNSADAKSPHGLDASDESLYCYVERYALCKSDETLSASRPSFSPLLQRKRSKTISARVCTSGCSSGVQCDHSSSSTHTVPTNESVPLKDENAPENVTCSVVKYLNGESCKKTKIESNVTSEVDKENNRVNGNIDINLPPFGTVQVYVSFTNETGADSGFCLQLHVTTLTTAREIIDLVVNQCNRTVLCADQKPMTCNQLDSRDFCLFAIFGTRGRSVPDNFRPLQLQNPWKKGRLYVRRTHDILAEIEHSQRNVHNI